MSDLQWDRGTMSNRRRSAFCAALLPRSKWEQGHKYSAAGLPGWIYDDPFANISVRLDYVNEILENSFIMGASTALDNVMADITGRYESVEEDCGEGDFVAPLSCSKTSSQIVNFQRAGMAPIEFLNR